MKYIANYKLSAFMKKSENLIVFNVFSTLIFIVFPCIYVCFLNGNITGDLFWMYEIGFIVINSVTLLKFYKNGKILNLTIRTITIDDENLTIETLPFHVLKFWIVKQKTKSVNFSELIFLKEMFPLKEKDYILDQSCLLVKIGEESFYFLDSFFDDDIIEIISTKGIDIQ
ncbi:hypothetical protein [Flavobacterium aestivum]|uniref:hypothetical protein n=1 Tax=Flavobacterium aestivum TaxID=3003257 RepID=UPI002285E2D3|nr:hypothetical protein [Flavobacterium aestivum]